MDISPEFAAGALGILLASSFVRFATVLTILRFGLGLRSMTFGIVTAGLALALATAVLERDLGAEKLSIFRPASLASADVEKTFRPVLERRTDKKLVDDLGDKLSKRDTPGVSEDAPFGLLLSAYVISELKIAFQIGLMVLVPFVVIDLLAANVLVMLGVTQITAGVLALPLKLLLFFAVDGWHLLIDKLLFGIGG